MDKQKEYMEQDIDMLWMTLVLCIENGNLELVRGIKEEIKQLTDEYNRLYPDSEL
jgi:hypothetical protein